MWREEEGDDQNGNEEQGKQKASRGLALCSHREEEVGLTRPEASAVRSKTRGHIQEHVLECIEI